MGLEIGSQAVRAVELGGGGARLRRFGQVELTPGAVVEGEITNPKAVSEALVKLWATAGFSTQRVVVGLSSRRVIVREASVPAMSATDFRSAMAFEAPALIPVPIENAVLDFNILAPDVPALDMPAPDASRADGGTAPQMRILLAAAPRDALAPFLEALKGANLTVEALEPLPVALMRTVKSTASAGAEAVVSIDGDLTSVNVRVGGAPLFNRTVAFDGSMVPTDVVDEPQLVAAASQAHLGPPDTIGFGPQARRLPTESPVERLVGRVVESLEYFLGQSGGRTLESVLLTGSGATMPGLADRLATTLHCPTSLVDPFAGLAIDASSFPSSTTDEARLVGLGTVGLAAWGETSPTARLSLLPPDVVEGRRTRQVATRAVIGALSALVVLAGLWFMQHRNASHTSSEVTTAVAQNQAESSHISSLGWITEYYAAVAGRQSQVATLTAGSVDWPALLNQIAAAMPADTTVSQIAFTSGSSASSSSTAGAGSSTLPAVTFSVTGTGGVEVVAQWLRALSAVPSLQDVNVASATSSQGTVTFSSTANVGPSAPKLDALGAAK